MNAGGRIIAIGRLPGWTALIRPFRDRPDVEVPWLFYSVPWTNPAGPTTPFTDRFYDDRENWFPPSIGITPFSMKPYFGPLPDPKVGPLVGTEDEWLNGLLYTTWQAGGYSAPCWPVAKPSRKTTGGVNLGGDGSHAVYPRSTGLGGVDLGGDGSHAVYPRSTGLGGVDLGGDGFSRQWSGGVGLGGVDLGGDGFSRQWSGGVGLGGVDLGGDGDSRYGVLLPLCPLPFPRRLYAHVSGSTRGDGVYPLDFQGIQGLVAVWDYSGPLGICSGAVIPPIRFVCNVSTAETHLRTYRPGPALFVFTDVDALTCVPLLLTFTPGATGDECASTAAYHVDLDSAP